MRLRIYTVSAHVAPSVRVLLSEQELTRLAQLPDEQRDVYVAAHGALRVELGRWLSCAPGDVPLHHALDSPSSLDGARQIAFSLSRKDALALIAVGRCATLSVDLESIEEARDLGLDMDAIAQTYFSPTFARRYHDAPANNKLETFLALWTRHEAFVKALGEGLLVGQPDRDPLDLGLVVEALAMPSGYVGAMACSRELMPSAQELEVLPWPDRH